MTNRYTNHIIDSELQRLSTYKDPFLKNGYMGLCLFLFAMYELTAAERYFDLAQQCLRLSCSSIKRRSRVNIANGLSGIGLSVLFLHKKGYIKGSLQTILKSIDDEIYRNVTELIAHQPNFSVKGHEEALMDVALYMTERIRLSDLSYAEERILKMFANNVLNKLYQDHDYSFYLEPIPYSINYALARFVLLLSRILHLDICRTRALHIWEEMRRTVLAQSPYFDCNKLLLLFALKELQKSILNDKELNETIERFTEQISFSHILNSEIPANAMSVTSGLPSIIGLWTMLKMPLDIPYLSELIQKIKRSSFYNMNYADILENKFTGLDGILGYCIAYSYLTKSYGKN